MARSRPHAILRNREEIVAQFGSHILAQEAYYDLGCHLDAPPAVDDVFEVMPLVDAVIVVEAAQRDRG